jgi:hypothetical protein
LLLLEWVEAINYKLWWVSKQPGYKLGLVISVFDVVFGVLGSLEGVQAVGTREGTLYECAGRGDERVVVEGRPWCDRRTRNMASAVTMIGLVMLPG